MTTFAPAAARRGFLLGALGVAMFAMTLPMTRLAVGAAAALGGVVRAVMAVVFAGRKMPVHAHRPLEMTR